MSDTAHESPKNMMELAAAERGRQVVGEGWSHNHDDYYVGGELGYAAVSYALHAVRDADARAADNDYLPGGWPWARQWWKPGRDDSNESRIRELVKAIALLIAEGERLQRLQAKQS